jgi:hypothetical protein
VGLKAVQKKGEFIELAFFVLLRTNQFLL